MAKKLNSLNEKSKREQKRRARTPLEQARDEREQVLLSKLKYKSLSDWTRKLEHMHTILTCEDSQCKFVLNKPNALRVVGKPLDEFEKAFDECRHQIKQMRDLLEQRAAEQSKGSQVVMKEQIRRTKDDIEQNVLTLKAILHNKRKKYKPDDYKNR